MNVERSCLLCGVVGPTEIRMVRWRDPVGPDIYATLPRCVDRAGCRERVEAAGDDWPVDDGTPPTYRPMVRPEPMPMPEPRPAPDEEVPSWL